MEQVSSIYEHANLNSTLAHNNIIIIIILL